MSETKPVENTQQATEQLRKIIIVAHDIEKAGRLFTDKAPSLAFTVGDGLGNILSTLKVNVQIRWPTLESDKLEIIGKDPLHHDDYKDATVSCYGDFSPECWDWWRTQKPSVIKACKNPEPFVYPSDAWQEVAWFLHQLEVTCPSSEGYTIVFSSDNTSFDTAYIDYQLDMWLQRKPMRFSSSGEYRDVVNVDNVLEAFEGTYDAQWMNAQLKKALPHLPQHDESQAHDAQYDATEIYWKHVKMLHIRRILMERVAVSNQ